VTASLVVVLRCDHDYEPPSWHRSCERRYTGANNLVVETRSTARRSGWQYVPGHHEPGSGRDLCLVHAKSATPAHTETRGEGEDCATRDHPGLPVRQSRASTGISD
jgi:hypothetical protein